VKGIVNTRSGKQVSLLNPQADTICIEDIAHSLSMQCRFNGHTRQFYSVAQHCVLLSDLVPQDCAGLALMHDAGEAYTGDITTPVHQCLEAAKLLEGGVFAVICRRFPALQKDCYLWRVVHRMDKQLCLEEARHLLPQVDTSEWYTDLPRIELPECYFSSWSPAEACSRFMSRYTSFLT
jgi:hypothetical protein